MNKKDKTNKKTPLSTPTDPQKRQGTIGLSGGISFALESGGVINVDDFGHSTFTPPFSNSDEEE